MCHEQPHAIICKRARKRQPAGNKGDGANDSNFQDLGESNWVVLENQADSYAYDNL